MWCVLALESLRSEVELKLLYRGEVVLDEFRARLLLLIDQLGSILAASKSMGITYSRAWECISRIERVVGDKIIEARRGIRGGARLTDTGRELLYKYLDEYRRIFNREFVVEKQEFSISGQVLVYSGSHDILLEKLFGILRDRGVAIETYWIGSLKGLASVVLGETDLAGIHLYDPDTSSYNISYVKKFSHGTDIVLIRGYLREQGFITYKLMSYREIVDGLLNGWLKLVNRNRGSGTRLLLDHILKSELSKQGSLDRKLEDIVRGYNSEVYTHFDVAMKVASREADVGVGIRWVAEAYKLYFTPITWEKFDFILLRNRLDRTCIKDFIKILREEVGNIIIDFKGYRLDKQIGCIIERI